MSGWDIALIAVVSIMGTAIAYLRDPEQKAFMLMLPVPFTLAVLAVGRPLDATNVLAIGLLLAFTFGVWLLHARWQWPILAAIAVCALGYGGLGMGLTRVRLGSDAVFWAATGAMLLLAVALIRGLPAYTEPPYRSPLPVWIKLPAIALVISGLVLVKAHLAGFVTMFPMVGVVAAYEARHSLWTNVRRIPWVIATMLPMMVVIRVLQDRVGVPGALAVAWPVFLVVLWAFRNHYAKADAATERKDESHDCGRTVCASCAASPWRDHERIKG
jgi:hypothetical protein